MKVDDVLKRHGVGGGLRKGLVIGVDKLGIPPIASPVITSRFPASAISGCSANRESDIILYTINDYACSHTWQGKEIAWSRYGGASFRSAIVDNSGNFYSVYSTGNIVRKLSTSHSWGVIKSESTYIEKLFTDLKKENIFYSIDWVFKKISNAGANIWSVDLGNGGIVRDIKETIGGNIYYVFPRGWGCLGSGGNIIEHRLLDIAKINLQSLCIDDAHEYLYVGDLGNSGGAGVPAIHKISLETKEVVASYPILYPIGNINHMIYQNKQVYFSHQSSISDNPGMGILSKDGVVTYIGGFGNSFGGIETNVDSDYAAYSSRVATVLNFNVKVGGM